MDNHKKAAGALKKVTSPEQLNDYVKVSNPGIWMFLSAVTVLLIAFFIWGFVGKLDTTYLCPAVSSEGSLNCYVSEKQGSELGNLLSVTVDGQEYPVVSISQEPVRADFLSDYVRHISGFGEDDWVYIVTAQTDLSNGVHEAVICTERVSPISFLID